MARGKIYLYGGFAFFGTAAMVGYFFWVASKAPSPFELALLIFAGVAAIVGWLGLWISWLTYRLEAGKVPKPDVAILVDGIPSKEWNVSVDLTDPADDFSREVEAERARLKGLLAPSPSSKQPLAGFAALQGIFSQVTSEQRESYLSRIDDYLPEYEEHLKEKALLEAFWKRSHPFVLAFTNERAGVPAQGVKVILRMPDKDEVLTLDQEEVPDEEDMTPPDPPSPPKPGLGLISPPVYPHIPALSDFTRGALGNVGPAVGNVSPPTIKEGSVILEYEVTEVLHNLHEDNRDQAVVVSFRQPGKWVVPYEVHARNLPSPKKGEIVIVATDSQSISAETETASE